jgi:hypothetical protein
MLNIMLKIKNRNDTLNEIINKAKKFPDGWKAVFGLDQKLLSNDYYLINPSIGIYLLKEFNKNPYETRGIGSHIARQVDDEIELNIQKYGGDFGILQGDIRKILDNIQKGIKPEEIFESAIDGKNNFGISFPIRGKASNSQKNFNFLNRELSSEKKKLDCKFEKIASDEKFYDSYG